VLNPGGINMQCAYLAALHEIASMPRFPLTVNEAPSRITLFVS
jgi:hypothetical protein